MRDLAWVSSAVHLHRPLSGALDDSSNGSDMSAMAQVDEFQLARQLQADEPGIIDG
jgi:hypothetical protein